MVASSSTTVVEHVSTLTPNDLTKKRSRNSFNEVSIDTIKQEPALKSARTEQNGIDTLSHSSSSNGVLLKPKLDLSSLYDSSVSAKIWGVAKRALNYSSPPTLFPEYTHPGKTEYIYRDADFWTSGFFPGSLYLLLERQRKYSHLLAPQLPHSFQLESACKWWTINLHQNATLLGTHDLGFMIAPWAKQAWELNHDTKAYDSLLAAAKTLGDRFDARVGAIRSWDTCVTRRYQFTDPTADYLVIIDNMLNLDLIFWAARELQSPHLRNLAITHARTSQKHHIRSDNTTCHVVNFDQATGKPKEYITNQGFSDESCWSRGQAWAITGFAQTYHWTRDVLFLDSSRACADLFLKNLPESGIPYWDFAVEVEEGVTPTDTSAAMIAAYGMLLIHEALLARGETSPYLNAALHIVTSVLKSKLAAPATFVSQSIEIPSVDGAGGIGQESGDLEVDMGEEEETILKGATINNFEFAPRRWANHGLVYADYYFLLVGNKLLEMGIGGL